MIFKNKAELISMYVGSGDTVLDVGFYGQSISPEQDHYPHALLKKQAQEVYGVDIVLPESYDKLRYQRASADSFFFETKFDVITAFDVIEHLSNPGRFLELCSAHLKPGGVVLITTPNAFNLFSLVEKVSHDEPNVNDDHTTYFNKPTISVLLQKNGFTPVDFHYLSDPFDTLWANGIKRKILATLYSMLGLFTDKFMATLVVVARPIRD